MYNYDPNDMGRYSSAASMAYFPTSSDPSMGGAMSSRDHTPSTFQSEQTKFGTQRGTADLSTPVAVSSTQQNQQSNLSLSFSSCMSLSLPRFLSSSISLSRLLYLFIFLPPFLCLMYMLTASVPVQVAVLQLSSLEQGNRLAPGKWDQPLWALPSMAVCSTPQCMDLCQHFHR